MKDYLNSKYNTLLLTIFFLLFSCSTFAAEPTTALFNEGISLIPYPQEVTVGGEDFVLDGELTVVLDRNASQSDRFAAAELVAQLNKEWGVNAVIASTPNGQSILLTHKGVSKKVKGLPAKKSQQGYELKTGSNQLVIRAKGDAGLFYGTQTLLQVLKKGPKGPFVPGMEITDWPDIPERASHYDTKHHQDKRSYVESFIRDLARYKINMLVWEWEDKFAYPSHPEIGAPGAFTMEEMQEITRYAKQYHIQLVPLVQGLGHVSFILKWPQYNDLREVSASNWEFCPLKEGSYELLFDLWEDAIEATPGSQYIHIGSDETYELGVCEECQKKVDEIGKSGLYHLFTGKAGKHLHGKGRKVMCWERPMGWKVGDSPARGIEPFEELVLTESYSYETPDFKYAREAKEEGFELFSYDPNPGVTPLMVPYMYARGEDGKTRMASLEKSHKLLTTSTQSEYFDGMINTSWDDAGLHNQMWMMSFIVSAEWSWSGNNPSLEEFTNKFFQNYYGEQSSDMRELYLLMNKAAYYYFESFERRVWHYGDVGKTHLPDLPRGDNLEYDEFWNREYADRIEKSQEQIKQMARAREIIGANQKADVKNSYDLELFLSMADLVDQTCNTYLALSKLERAVKEAHNQRYLSHHAAYNSLENAIEIIETNLSARQKVYDELVTIWEKTRLPKGMSTEDKEFFHRQDRARHFAFRRADMSYLICDEELLGLEDYRDKLLDYMKWYKQTYIQ